MSSKLVVKKDGTVRNKKNNLEKVTLFDVINNTVMFLLILISLYPIWYVLCISLSSTEAINNGLVSLWPVDINIDAYKEILKTPRIPRAYWNSILYTFLHTVFAVGTTVLFAYPLSRKKFVFRKPLMLMVVFTMFFSGGMIPAYLLLRSLHLLDSMWALILSGLITTFDLVIIKNFYEGLPHEMYEAAIVDGANEFTILLRIFIPLAKPAIASITLFLAMGTWNSYLSPSIYFTTPEKFPLPVILKEMLIDMTSTNSNNADENQFTPEAIKNATIFVSVLPFLIVYPFLQKYFVKGVAIGAVKG